MIGNKWTWVVFLFAFMYLAACNPRSDAATQPITPVIPSPITLKPADSDTPAAGICGSSEGEIVEILLGSGPDGLPLSGRCIQVTADQRLRLVNMKNEPVAITFGPFQVDLAVGEEMLLDLPVGDYLAIGVHHLPDAPEIWLVEP